MIRKITESGNLISLTAKLNKNELYKITEKENMFSLTIYKKPQVVRGIASRTKDNQHVTFLDYDNVSRDVVESELTELGTEGIFYLFKTKEEKIKGELIGNYHAVCLRKLCPAGVVMEQHQTSCDQAYTSMPLRNRYRNWVLRWSDKKGSGKPVFIKVIGVKTNCIISTAHRIAIERCFPKVPHIEYPNEDGLYKLYFNEYETA